MPQAGSGTPPANPLRFQRDEQALRRFRLALAQAPEDLSIRRLMVLFLLGQGAFPEARSHLEYMRSRGVRGKDWSFSMAWALLGEGCEQLAEATVGEDAVLCTRLAYKASDLGRWGAFERLARRAAVLQPDSTAAAFDHAISLDYLGDFQRSLEVLRQLEAREGLDPESRQRAILHRSQTLLLLGDLEEGFRLMETRISPLSARPMPFPEWDGSPLEGRPILLRVEQGIGDMLMFLRYAVLLTRQGAKVYLEAMEGVQELIRACPGIKLLEDENLFPDGLIQAPLMSLAHRLGTHLGSIPAPIPYLRAPEHAPGRSALERLIPGCPSPRIGLVWAGNGKHPRNHERSVPPACLDRLGGVPGITWFSLQKGAGPRPALPMVDLAPHLQDFSDTALALSMLDGLVTVDTSVAHLAGALGLPVWLLLPHFPDWRWMLGRSDSPWYPSFRILRQTRHWGWDDVMVELMQCLPRRSRPSASLVGVPPPGRSTDSLSRTSCL